MPVGVLYRDNQIDSVTRDYYPFRLSKPIHRVLLPGWVFLVFCLAHLPIAFGQESEQKVLTEWSELKGLEGFEDLEGFDDPDALDDIEDLEDLEDLEGFEELLEEEGLDLELPIWEFESTVSGSLGYKDNILLQPVPTESSAFWRTGLELFLWRLPKGKTEFMLVFDATDVRFFSTDETDGEQVAFLHSAFNWLMTDWSKLGIKGQVVYQDQVLDMSANESEPFIGQVQVFSYTFDPEWEVSLTRDLTVAVTGLARADRFREGPDDFDDLGGRFGVGYRMGLWGELDLRLSALQRDYATRLQYTAGGRPILGSKLSVDQKAAELRFKLGVSSNSRWAFRTKLAWLEQRDNGSSYFDYNRATLGLELSWRPKLWRFTLGADFHHYEYLTQTVWVGELESRQKDDFYARFLTERRLTESLSWQLEAGWESSQTNDVYGNYDATNIFTGVSWTF